MALGVALAALVVTARQATAIEKRIVTDRNGENLMVCQMKVDKA